MKFEPVDPSMFPPPNNGKGMWKPVAEALRAGNTLLIRDVNPNTLRAALRQNGIRSLSVRRVEDGYLISSPDRVQP